MALICTNIRGEITTVHCGVYQIQTPWLFEVNSTNEGYSNYLSGLYHLLCTLHSHIIVYLVYFSLEAVYSLAEWAESGRGRGLSGGPRLDLSLVGLAEAD